MMLGKRMTVLGLVCCVFCGASFGAINPEWHPFKLGFVQSIQDQAPPPGQAIHPATVEITLWGGFLGGFGLQKADNVAPDLLTGLWSPWFGQGYTAFNWGYGQGRLDGIIAGPMLKKEGGILAGLSLGFVVSPSLQVDVFFQYGFSGYAIDDNIWAEFAAVQDSSVQIIRSIPRTVDYPTNSFQKAGKTISGGINLNFLISTFGPIMPYLSVGGGILSVTDLPSVAWSMSQSDGGSGATYNLSMEYDSKIAPLASAGLGFKFFLDPNYKEFLAPNFGIKVEARALVAMIDLPKNLGCGFTSMGPGWTNYDGYNNVALNEKGFPVMFSVVAGLFYAF